MLWRKTLMPVYAMNEIYNKHESSILTLFRQPFIPECATAFWVNVKRKTMPP
uniref:Uncharacterized protein n=1 Tax=Anguilla anguilla TaxID=7936 RepID=A0A0E9TJR0_ANGAN